MQIHKIKCVEDLIIELPIEKGLYAITGANGSGKSTIVTCASSVFFNMPMNEYLGKTEVDSFINFKLGEATRSWSKEVRNGSLKWTQHSDGAMNIKGFYEGSLIFGNRFRNNSYERIKQIEIISNDKLIEADDFIRTNLGNILHGNTEFYEKLYLSNNNYNRDNALSRPIFFYEKNGKRISQFHMSTGENLLVSILYSLYLRNEDRASLNKPCIMFLDEIELALHPSSLKKLLGFLSDIAIKYNYAVYFSTHSIELISGIKPDNIFYIERYPDNSIEIINPCYPAYATKILYDHSGYDNVFLVEDDLAKEIVVRILKKKELLNSRLVHVLPCGGYTNVIGLADDVVRHNLLGKTASISIILDGDVEAKANEYRIKSQIANNIPLNFLPIESLEKYLRSNLYLNVDHKLFRWLSDYVFQQKSLKDIIDEYSKLPDSSSDTSGKKLFALIDSELRERRKERIWLVEMVVDYLFENNPDKIARISQFLIQQMKR